MDKLKEARLRAAGWVIGTVEQFLNAVFPKTYDPKAANGTCDRCNGTGWFIDFDGGQTKFRCLSGCPIPEEKS